MIRLNPFARVETIRGAAGAIDGLRVVAPVRGRGLQTNVILRADDEPGFVACRRAVLSALLDAEQGRDASAAADDRERERMRRFGLFVNDEELPSEVDTPVIMVRDDPVAPDQEQLASRGFVILRQVIGSESLLSCREYYGALVDQGFAQYGGNAGEPHRWVLYNDPLARLLHRTIGRFAGLAVPEPLTPSFAYFLKYLEGASLARHRDREQCAVTAVLQVDFDPARPGPTPWPLMFVRDGQTIAVTLAPGDLVVFRGTEIEHYREPLACGRSSTNLAFCFVPAGFAGSLA